MNQLPNFLVVVTDHEQAQVIAPEHPCRTPHAQQLAAAGVRFTRCYTPAAHCCPSRATLFTGLYPSQHGVFNNVLNEQAIHASLNPGVVTFGERLRDAGYDLAFAGKWHVCADETPADRGWRELITTSVKGERHGLTWEQWERRAAALADNEPRKPGEILRPGWGRYRLYGTLTGAGVNGAAYAGHRDYTIASAAMRELAHLARSTRPWCLYVGLNGPHDPYMIPEKYARMYDPDTIPLPVSYSDHMEDKPRIYQRQRRQLWDQLSAAEVRSGIAHYWGYCTMLDDMLGEILAALDRTGCAESTAVLFLSDHGDYAGAHGIFAKGVAAFDEAYHIPMILRWPAGGVRPGRIVDEFVTLADVAPTLYEIGGAGTPAGLTGRSLLPFLCDQTPSCWPDTFYSQFNGVELYYSQRIVQTRTSKYVFNGFDFDEYYDLVADPHELHNLAGRPEVADAERELVARMWRFARHTGDTMHNPYITVGLAPYGPMTAFKGEAP